MTVDCSSCGENLQVPDEYMGSTVTCPHCEALVLVPEAPHEPPQSMRAAPTPSVPASLTPSYFNVVNPAPATWVCQTCHRSFPPGQVYQQDGTVICHDCYARVTALDTAALSETESAGSVDSPDGGYDAAHPDAMNSQVADAEGYDARVDEGLAAVTESHAPPPLGARAEGQNSNWVIWTVAGSVGVIALATILIISNNSPTPTPGPEASVDKSQPAPAGPTTEYSQPMSEWEKKTAPTISHLRSQARLMLADKDLRGAVGAYQEMLNVAGTANGSVMTSSLTAQLDEAREGLKKLRPQLPPDAFVSAQALQSPAEPPDSGPVVVYIKSGSPKSSSNNSSGDATKTDTSDATVSKPDETKPPKATVAPEEPSAPPPVVDEANWEPAHRAQVIDLLTQADTLAGDKPLDALQRYEEALVLVDTRLSHLKDADLKSRLAAADSVRRKLLAPLRDTDQVRLMTARALLQSAIKGETTGKWNSALEQATDARHLLEKIVQGGYRFRDNDFLTTLLAQASAYLQLQQAQKANEIFSDSDPLGRLASMIVPGSDPPRALVYNRAINDIIGKANVMRSVKMLHDYMEKHKETDEALLNVLGTALGLADEIPPKDRKLLDSVIGFYGQRNIDLERTKPGQRRWGIQWMSEDDVKQKYDEMNKAITEWQDKMHDRDEAAAAVKRAEDDAKPTLGGRRSNKPDSAVTSAKATLEAKNKEVATARAAVPRVPWLTDLKPIAPTYDPTATMTTAAPAAAPLSRPVLVRDPNSDDLPRVVTATQPAPSSQPAAPTIPPPPSVSPLLLRVQRTALAFPVDKTHLLTAADPIGDAKNVRLQDTGGSFIAAKVVAKTDHLALLEVDPADVGGALHYLDIASDYSSGAVRCVAIPEPNLFAPAATYLNAENIAPPKGATWTVGLTDHPRLPGSPLIDAQNNVIGVVFAQRDDSRQRLGAVTLSEVTSFLRANHALPASPSGRTDPLGVYQVSIDKN